MLSLRGPQCLGDLHLDGTVSLGSDTTAHVRTGTLLGERVLTLESKGDGTMRPMDVIPVSRTASPYSLTEAVSELTTNTAGTDTASLNQSLDTLSATLDQIAPQLGPTFDGLTRLSQAINDRDDTFGELLKRRRRRDEDPLGPQPAGEHADPQRQRSGGGVVRAAPRDRRAARPHVRAVQAAVRVDSRQRAGAGADAGQAQLGHGDAGEEPRQHRQGAARVGEVPDHSWRDDRQRPVLPGVRPQLVLGAAAAALPGLRIRVPARRQRRTAAGQCRSPRRTSVPVQRDSRTR